MNLKNAKIFLIYLFVCLFLLLIWNCKIDVVNHSIVLHTHTHLHSTVKHKHKWTFYFPVYKKNKVVWIKKTNIVYIFKSIVCINFWKVSQRFIYFFICFVNLVGWPWIQIVYSRIYSERNRNINAIESDSPISNCIANNKCDLLFMCRWPNGNWNDFGHWIPR